MTFSLSALLHVRGMATTPQVHTQASIFISPLNAGGFDTLELHITEPYMLDNVFIKLKRLNRYVVCRLSSEPLRCTNAAFPLNRYVVLMPPFL